MGSKLGLDIPQKLVNTYFGPGFIIYLFDYDGTIEAVAAIFGGQVASYYHCSARHSAVSDFSCGAVEYLSTHAQIDTHRYHCALFDYDTFGYFCPGGRPSPGVGFGGRRARAAAFATRGTIKRSAAIADPRGCCHGEPRAPRQARLR